MARIVAALRAQSKAKKALKTISKIIKSKAHMRVRNPGYALFLEDTKLLLKSLSRASDLELVELEALIQKCAFYARGFSTGLKLGMNLGRIPVRTLAGEPPIGTAPAGDTGERGGLQPGPRNKCLEKCLRD